MKVCDFNWSTFLPNGGKAKPCICGTTEYMPPEVVKKEKHDKGVDIWALGILLYVSLLINKFTVYVTWGIII